jgi:GMP synthase (glutamine-hydrolysing)
MKSALAISHVAFENLGLIEDCLLQAGYQIEQCDAATGQIDVNGALDTDLVIVLGGPIGVYEQDHYPFLAREMTLLRKRLAAERPTLGICLGAQLMAAALGARVYPGPNGKEIGWLPLKRAAQSDDLPALSGLFNPCLPVLHWHGDTFDLPVGASHLASSTAYPNQAFALGQYALALQFHLEATAEGLERWYVGHACELAQAGIDVAQLRRDSQRHAPMLQQPVQHLMQEWLAGLAA